MNSLIRVDGLDITFKNLNLLKNVKLEIAPGELVQLAGPNGCGKTSLMETLIGLRESFQVRRSFSPQEYGYLPQINKVHPKISLRLQDVCDQSFSFYPQELFDRHWSFASGGEKMKSLIARTFAIGEKILFLDEPFNHLDKEASHLVAQIIQQKVEEGMTIVYIGHDQFDITQRVIKVDQWSF